MSLTFKILLTLSFAGHISCFFDCRRDDTTCSISGVCGFTTGVCACSDVTNTDYVCKLEPTKVVVVAVTDCLLQCQNGGTCYKDTGAKTDQCHCPAAFYGTLCENERATVDCKGDQMSISLSPYTKPAKVFAMGSSGTECQATEAVVDSGLYEVDLVYGPSACGTRDETVTDNDTPNVGDVTYTNYILVSYGEFLESSIDDIYTIVCVVSADVNVEIRGDISQVTVDKKQDLMKGRADGSYSGVLFELIDAGGFGITTAQLGAPISMRIYLKDTNVYETMKITSCSAADSLDATTTPAPETIVLVENGCVKNTPPASFVVRSGLSEGTHPITSAPFVQFDLTVFKFTSGIKIYFKCAITLCRVGDTACTLDPNCPLAPTIVPGRRRRDVITPDGVSSVTGILQVINPLERSEDQQVVVPETRTTEECTLSGDVLTMLIVMASAVFILAFFCVFISMRYITSRSRVDTQKDVTTKDVSLKSSATPNSNYY